MPHAGWAPTISSPSLIIAANDVEGDGHDDDSPNHHHAEAAPSLLPRRRLELLGPFDL